ncbi:uncharacterized protein C17orf64 homolog [Megalops cyprinoides]|uniref:uncharacterized protein C17orf64 homolog n=1 Tax=Megalops cyprinoides TaxID=118141 RepID=UPI001864E98A|nr:uncharacterized protein C17orf64 homolog [Megalops cyprinoides]
MDTKLTAGCEKGNFGKEGASSAIPPLSSPSESSSAIAAPSKKHLLHRRRTRRTIYSLCKRLLKPVQMELLLLSKRDLSRWHEELQHFHLCIRKVGRHLHACLRKLSNSQDREAWEINLWEYVSLHTIFEGAELRILYRHSNDNFNIFKVTYEKLRFNFLATELLVGSCDLQQLYEAWGLCGVYCCTDCRHIPLNCSPQNTHQQRSQSGSCIRADGTRGQLDVALYNIKQGQHKGLSPDTLGHNIRRRSRDSTEEAASDMLKLGKK